jgi:hypothetical protein
MNQERLQDLARRARQIADAYAAAAEGRFHTMDAQLLEDMMGASIDFPTAQVFEGDEFNAIWTEDGRMEVWAFDDNTGEPPHTNTKTGDTQL